MASDDEICQLVIRSRTATGAEAEEISKLFSAMTPLERMRALEYRRQIEYGYGDQTVRRFRDHPEWLVIHSRDMHEAGDDA